MSNCHIGSSKALLSLDDKYFVRFLQLHAKRALSQFLAHVFQTGMV
jgi:hypothetical protein